MSAHVLELQGTAEVTARLQEEQQKGRLREAGTTVNPVPSLPLLLYPLLWSRELKQGSIPPLSYTPSFSPCPSRGVEG